MDILARALTRPLELLGDVCGTLSLIVLFCSALWAPAILAGPHPIRVADAPANTPSLIAWPNWTAGAPPSVLELGPPQVTGAVATLTFANELAHWPDSEGEYVLTWGDVTVRVVLQYEVNGTHSEALDVEAHGGLIAVPPHIEVPESHAKQVHIFPGGLSS